CRRPQPERVPPLSGCCWALKRRSPALLHGPRPSLGRCRGRQPAGTGPPEPPALSPPAEAAEPRRGAAFPPAVVRWRGWDPSRAEAGRPPPSREPPRRPPPERLRILFL